MVQILLFSAIAGICGTGLGGLGSAMFIKRSTENITCWMLSFAAGIMISIVCFGLLPEAFELANIAVCVFGLVFGIIIVMVLNRIVEKKIPFINDRSKMIRSGMLIYAAIGLHNIPEGIAICTGGSYDFHFGIMLAVMIALHNIPEGMAIAVPLLVGGINKWKVVFLTALSGAPTFLGGLIGVLVSGISNMAIAISLSVAGGAMLYVVFGEMIPQAIVTTKNKAAFIATLLGVIAGLALAW